MSITAGAAAFLDCDTIDSGKRSQDTCRVCGGCIAGYAAHGGPASVCWEGSETRNRPDSTWRGQNLWIVLAHNCSAQSYDVFRGVIEVCLPLWNDGCVPF